MNTLNQEGMGRVPVGTDHHQSEGAMGEVAGTGAGAISGGIVGAAVGGPIGAVVGAVAGGMLGNKGGEVAHEIGDDHDGIDPQTGSEGLVGRTSGAGAGALGGAVVGTAGGPVGTVVGAVAGGMLGAGAGDAAKHIGADESVGNGVAGVQTGGHAYDGTPDTRGISEKTADALTGDRMDDKTGKIVR